MATYNCYIRTWLPLTVELKPNTGSTGHFDLQINKTNFEFATKTYGSSSATKTTRSYDNPILSYGGGGYVTVYDSADYVMDDDMLMCKYKFTGNDTGISDVIEWLETYCEYDAAESSSTIHKYKVVSGKFATYNKIDRSCFACAAVWCEMLGYSTLMNIYNNYTYPNGNLDSDGYKNYTAWPMFRANHRAWIFDALKV